MKLFDSLLEISGSEAELELFLQQNIQKIYDLQHSHYSVVLEEKDAIDNFIESKGNIIENLDYSISQNKAFISILFDFCERFGFISTVRIENALQKKEIYLGKRREAAKLYLLNIRDNNEYIDRFESICCLLQDSIFNEEDNDKKVINSFANYFSKVVRDTSYEFIQRLINKIIFARQSKSYTFINHPHITEIISFDFSELSVANNNIQKSIELFLGHIETRTVPIAQSKEIIFIEKDNSYSKELIRGKVTFDRIRKIAIDKCRGISNILPGRGVTQLVSEDEMYVYIKRYGNMHKSKLLSAFNKFPFNEIINNVELFDWACGQGLATLVLNDFLSDNSIDIKIKNVNLIEPSKICLIRASLNISTANNVYNIRTICKDLDSLKNEDVTNNENYTKIHLFSNILDIGEELFSQLKLLKLIEKTQKGINYFICVSPYITDEKADRVDNFCRYFEDKYASFYLLEENENGGRPLDKYWSCNQTNYTNYNHGTSRFCGQKITEEGCENKWTRVIRVFKVEL